MDTLAVTWMIGWLLIVVADNLFGDPLKSKAVILGWLWPAVILLFALAEFIAFFVDLVEEDEKG